LPSFTLPPPPISTLFPYTTLFRSADDEALSFGPPPINALLVIPGNIAFLNQFFSVLLVVSNVAPGGTPLVLRDVQAKITLPVGQDRKSTRLNSSHVSISYAVFCLK